MQDAGGDISRHDGLFQPVEQDGHDARYEHDDSQILNEVDDAVVHGLGSEKGRLRF